MEKHLKGLRKASLILLAFLIIFKMSIDVFTYFDSRETVKNIDKYNDTQVIIKSDNSKKDVEEIKENIEKTVKNKELEIKNNQENQVSEVIENKEITSKSIDYLDIKEEVLAKDFETLKETEKINKLGTIYISDLNIELPIFEGKPYVNVEGKTDTMLFGAVTNKENQVMGRGNYVLASHIVSNPDLLFTSIKTLEKGSYIYLYDSKYSYEYRVYKQFTVLNTETWILNDIKDCRILTLYTCLRDGTTTPKNRTVVRAILTNIKPI